MTETETSNKAQEIFPIFSCLQGIRLDELFLFKIKTAKSIQLLTIRMTARSIGTTRDSKNGGAGGSPRDVIFLNDDFGRIIKVTGPDFGTWLSNYDNAGNLVASKDNSGAVLNYTYDNMNRRLSVSSQTTPSDNVTFYYEVTPSIPGASFTNTAGKLTEITSIDMNGHQVNSLFSYDYRGRLTSDVEQRQIAGATAPSNYITTYGWDPNGQQLDTITYPDGLVVTRKYSTAYGPRPRGSEIDVPFQGGTVQVVSNVARDAAGKVAAYTSGSGSTTSITRNKRGEVTNLTVTNPNLHYPYSPIWQEDLSYDANQSVVGEASQEEFLKGKQNQWQWQLGYDYMGRVTTWTTNQVQNTSAPTNVDNYAWTYDEVGNRTSETYNGVNNPYHYNFASGNDNTVTLNQLASVAGISRNYPKPINSRCSGTTIFYGLQLAYDKSGSVSNDSYASIVGPAALPGTYGTKCITVTQNWIRNFKYNSRHHLREIDLNIVPDGNCAGDQIPINPIQPICAGLTGPLQEYSYDGLDRVTETNCIPEGGGLALGVQTGYGICATNPWHKHEYFYDYRGRILEELDLNPLSVINVFGPNPDPYTIPCPTFDIVDHIYLGDQEVGRVLRQGNPGSACQAGDPDVDIEYVHQDSRGAIVAVESQMVGAVVAEGSVSPFGQTQYMGLPGPSGKIGGADHVAASVAFDAGVGGAMPDGGMGVPEGGLTPDVGRINTVSGYVLAGGSTYIGVGSTNPGGGPIPTSAQSSPLITSAGEALKVFGAVGGLAKASRMLGPVAQMAAKGTAYGAEAYSALGAGVITAGLLAKDVTDLIYALDYPHGHPPDPPTLVPQIPSDDGVYGPGAGSYGGGGTFQRDYIGGFGYAYPELRPHGAASTAPQCAARIRAST